MARAGVDTRKLKDSVSEFLKKGKFEKAAEVLEQLVKGEPKEMQHRLKLGDTYRRMEQTQKAVNQYQAAGRIYADEGLLIKAIGAIKIILEIDPKNHDAQKQLAEMNNRRFAKPTLEQAGLRAPRGIGLGARGTSSLELSEGESAAESIADLLTDVKEGGPHRYDEAEEEALELDDGKEPAPPPLPRKGVAPAGGPVLRPKPIKPGPRPESPERLGPPPVQRPKHDLGSGRLDGGIDFDPADLAPPAPELIAPPPPPKLRPPVPKKVEETSIDLEPLLPDAILLPEAEDELIPLPADAEIAPAQEQPAARAKPIVQPAPRFKPAAPAARVVEEISFEGLTPARAAAGAQQQKAPRPIADLLSSESEEEIELLSISSDEEAAEARRISHPKITGSDSDIDQAFGAISPAAPLPKHKLPARVPLFDDLGQDAFVELVNKLSYHRHVPGQLIIREGDPGRSFFVIVEGKVRVFKRQPDGKELTLAHLGEGAFFGEMALLSGAPRTANVVAEEETEILEVSDVVLRELAQRHPNVIASLKNFYRQRLLNNVMAISPLFQGFDQSQRKRIVEKFKLRQAAPGEVLITEGKPSDGLYVVLHGSVAVAAKAGNQHPVPLAKLKEGDIFGEMSLLTRKPATATVSSLASSILLKLPRENFQELLMTHPQILELVSELNEQRKSATEAILHGQGPGHDGMSFV